MNSPVPVTTHGANHLDSTLLHVAATCVSTRALGPGLRAVVWVQGCPFSCQGCISPDWIPFHQARTVRPEDLVDELLSQPETTGITFSGGEPFAQAQGLSEVARLARSRRAIDIICFSGYRYEQILKMPEISAAKRLLEEIDVLIDGPFIASRRTRVGLRGSDNQRFWHITDRLRNYDFEGVSRRLEVNFHDQSVLMVGIPPVDIQPGEFLDRVFNHSPAKKKESVHERA